jgi:hypothetical protein
MIMPNDLRIALDEKSDLLNEAIERAEACLASLHIGVSACVPLSDGAELAFDKLEGKWRLAVSYEKDGELTPLRNAPRFVRIEAVAWLPTLHEALFAAGRVELQRVEAALVQANAFTDKLHSGE